MSQSKTSILAFAGSLREKSYNRALTRAAKEVAPDNVSIDIFLLDDIPLYNGDVEAEGFPAAVKHFHEAIRSHDALLIATPEYQYSFPGVLKNAIDWGSRPPKDSPMMNKPVAIMGATPGKWGTARAQAQLRQCLFYNAIPMVLDVEVLVSEAKNKFDENLKLTDEAARDFIRKLVESLAKLAAASG